MTVASTTKVIIASFDPFASGLEKPTVIRTRGNVCHRPDSTIGADAAYVGAYGVGVVLDQAFAAGVASVPGPFDQADWDGWLVWGNIAGTFQFGSDIGVENLETCEVVDSKGMRKISDNETLVLVAESQGGPFDITMAFRQLFKLS